MRINVAARELAAVLAVTTSPGEATSQQREQGRHRRRGSLDVVGGVAREVEDQCLVDLGLDIEGVTQLVDPVVKVHEPIFHHRGDSSSLLA